MKIKRSLKRFFFFFPFSGINYILSLRVALVRSLISEGG